MYLLYLDDSGNPDGNQDSYFVLGGLAVFERDCYWINEAVDDIEYKYFGSRTSVEFHAQPITSHKDEPWNSMASSKRTELLSDLCSVILKSNATLFGIAVDIKSNKNPIDIAFEDLASRFDLLLKRLHAQGNTQRGLMVCDKTRYETRLQGLLHTYRSKGTRFGSVKNFAEVPLFTDSKSTRLLQLADLVAYSIYRRYDRSQTWLLDKLVPKFDHEDITLHGLMHLTPNRDSCSCPACMSRRLNAR